MVYSNASIIAIILGFFCLGYLFNTLLRKIVDWHNDGKYKKEIMDIFQSVLDNLYTNKTSFGSRINNTVTIITELNQIGMVNVVYLMDRHDIAIFKGDKCIYTSDSIDNSIVDEIIVGLDVFYKHEINDVVNVMGMVFSRDEFESKFKIRVEDMKKGMFNHPMKEEMSDIEKIKRQNEVKFNIDDILDRITSVGIENLTPEEKRFLDSYNNE
jgi:hypothetical protein